MEKEEIFAVSIIFLFLSVAIGPSVILHTVEATRGEDSFKVTTQVCGLQGYGETSVRLSQQQYLSLGEYLVRFKAQLNQTSTREETVSLFKDAVGELQKYGLLPHGMSVAQAQRLVTAGYGRYPMDTWMRTPPQGTLNMFCLFAAITDGVIDYNVWMVAGGFLSSFIPYDSPLILLVYFLFFVGFVKPLRLFNMLVVPGYGGVPFYFTLGLQGVSVGLDDIGTVVGFSGLKVWLNTQNALYLGGAVMVNSRI